MQGVTPPAPNKHTHTHTPKPPPSAQPPTDPHLWIPSGRRCDAAAPDALGLASIQMHSESTPLPLRPLARPPAGVFFFFFVLCVCLFVHTKGNRTQFHFGENGVSNGGGGDMWRADVRAFHPLLLLRCICIHLMRILAAAACLRL